MAASTARTVSSCSDSAPVSGSGWLHTRRDAPARPRTLAPLNNQLLANWDRHRMCVRAAAVGHPTTELCNQH